MTAADRFSTVLGVRRGTAAKRNRDARVLRERQRAAGRRPDSSGGDVGKMDGAQAARMTCPDCGGHGLNCEHFRAQRPARISTALVCLLVLAAMFGGPTGVEGIQVAALCVAVVTWYMLRDWGRRALAVCPSCRYGQQL